MKKKDYNRLVETIYEYCNTNLIKPDGVNSLMEDLKLSVLERYFDSAPGTYVLKKNGMVEIFDEEKLYVSIGNASDDIEEPLTRGDIHNVVKRAMHSLKKGNVSIVPTSQIKKEILKSLKDLGFDDVYNKYTDYAENY